MRSENLGSVTQTVSEKLNIRLSTQPPHPLAQLATEEIHSARDIVRHARSTALSVVFRTITLEEPAKATLIPFLAAEHSGRLTPRTERPPRLARVLYDVILPDKSLDFCDSLVNIATGQEISYEVVDKKFHSPMNADEIALFPKVAMASPIFKAALAELSLPENINIVIDPWMYGGWENPEENSPYYMQGLVYARDPKTNNPDSNHYAFPLPLIPVMDMKTSQIVRVDRLATGGRNDGHDYQTGPKEALAHCKASEYIPELVEGGLRQDLKPLNIIQPYGPSFTVTDNSLVEWQKWRFRVGFNPREGATIHDLCYDGRNVLYRLSFSEMSVPYGDPRAPFHRKQAFDFGDGGAGRAANNLELGCDCLGLIKYFDAVMNDTTGTGVVSKNVICMHEEDDGILWKHTNYRTSRAVVTRNRKLIIQFIITLANYEYIFAYHFDQAGGIMIETRATGVVSTVPIDPGKTSPWGNVVSPGVLAQNHQHLFCVRIDPAIDGHKNTVIQEESHPLPYTPELNPYGNGYEVRQTILEKSCGVNAAPQNGRIFKIVNPNVRNPISGRPVGYKLVPSPTQLTLAHPDSVMAKRMGYANHHIWVTKHMDGKFWAAGQFTNQSSVECGGVKDMAEREDDIDNEDIVVWHTFGLTHNPRIEDFPVMPVEIHRIDLKPADFFSRNPAIDVPSSKNLASKLHNVGGFVNGFIAEIPQKPDVEHRTLSTNDEVPKSVRKCCV
ncbi:copper amine oxidase [Geopyxis carbonaria]|nr:copper amine oxidase [Geopyxis carbonaria]